MNNNDATTPMFAQNILQPNDMDILCGSGKVVSNHPGNKRFRAIVAKHYDAYECTTTRREKMKVTRQVMEEIRFPASSVQTRFLKKDPIFESFYVTKKRVGRDKISHCLRELKIESDRCARMKRRGDDFGQRRQIRHRTNPNKNEMMDSTMLVGLTCSSFLETLDCNDTSTQRFAPNNTFEDGAYAPMESTNANQRGLTTTAETALPDGPALRVLQMPSQVDPGLQVSSKVKHQSQAMTPLERLYYQDSENGLQHFLQSDAHHRTGMISEPGGAATVHTEHAQEGQDYASAIPTGSTTVQQSGCYHDRKLQHQQENDSSITIPTFGGHVVSLLHISPALDNNTFELRDKASNFQQNHGALCATTTAAPLQYHALSALSPEQNEQDNNTAEDPPPQQNGKVAKLKLLIKELTAQVMC